MNTFKQKKAVAECKRLRSDGRCPRKCVSFRGKEPFCKEAFSAERRYSGAKQRH